MGHFTLKLSPQGPLLDAFIGVSVARQQALKIAGQNIPAAIQIRALIDTGASASCVDPSILKTLSLSPTGSVSVVTPSTGGTAVNADQYDVSLVISTGNDKHVPLIVNTLPVVCADLLTLQGFHALIGRDILTECVFSYNGSIGFFTLAF